MSGKAGTSVIAQYFTQKQNNENSISIASLRGARSLRTLSAT